MDDLTTSGLAGSEELSRDFVLATLMERLVWAVGLHAHTLTLVPLLTQVFEAKYLACGQISLDATRALSTTSFG